MSFPISNVIFTSGNTATYSGNIAGNNINSTGVISATGNIVAASITTTGSSGNITGANIIGANALVANGNLKLQPNISDNSSYLDIFLTTGPDVHIAGNSENVIIGRDDGANVTVGIDGNVYIQADSGNAHTWTFDNTGNLTLPNNTFAVNYANGTPVTFSGGSSNLLAVTTDIIPSANNTQSLGNATNQWQDLWVSNATIYFNSVPLSVGPGNTLTIGNANVVTTTGAGNTLSVTSISVSGNVDAGNILTSGVVSAAGNVRGNNINTVGVVTATGNIYGNYFIGNGSQLTGITATANTGNIGFVGDAIYDSNGIYLENANLTTAATAALLLPANGNTDNIQLNNSEGNIVLQAGTGDALTAAWLFDSTGNLNLPIDGDVNFDGGNIHQAQNKDFYVILKDQDNDDWGLYNRVNNGSDTTLSQTRLRRNDFTITTDYNNDGFNWAFDNFGVLNLPGNINGAYAANTSVYAVNDGTTGSIELKTISFSGETLLSNLRVGNDSVTISTATAAYNWEFDNTGNLALPRGGVVYETGIPFGGLEGNTIALKPSGGTNADQQLLVYPTAGADFNHLHLTTGNLWNTEMFLGNDDFYVKLANTGNIVINANDNTGNTARWTFGTEGTILNSGNLTLQTPNGIPSSTANINSSGFWETNPVTNLATTGGTGTGLTVNVIQEGGYAGTITIATPGTGYSNGDVISVVSGSSSATFTISVLANGWTFDTTGVVALPTISLGAGLDEQTTIQSQRKLIPPFRWSAEITADTPTVVYTATDVNTTSMKVTIQVQHQGLGFELFEVFATFAGSTDTYYVVNNRVAPTTIDPTTVEVSLTGSNVMQITLTINSGANFSWVTYDAVEFGIPND